MGAFEQHGHIYTRTHTHLPHIHHHRVELATISDVHDVRSIAMIENKIGSVSMATVVGDLLVTQMSGVVQMVATFAVWLQISGLQRLYAVHRSLRFTAASGFQVFLPLWVPAVFQISALI